MSTLHIYNSQGKRLGDGPATDGDRIEDFFFDGVRLYVDTSGDPEIILFFRARESEAGRAEQYYAVYRTDTSTGLFERFERDLRTEIEDTRGMILQTTSEDAQLVTVLTGDPEIPGTDEQHGAMSSLLAERTALRIGVTTEAAAFGLISRYIGSPAERFAIVDDTTTDSVTDCDLAIEPGGDSEFEPLGDTVDVFDERLRRTTANADRPRASKQRGNTEQTNEERLEEFAKSAAAVGIGIVLAVLVLTSLLNGAALIGLEFPGTDWLIVV